MSTQPHVIEKLINKEKDDVENTPQGQFMEKKALPCFPTSFSLAASFEQFLSLLILSNESSIPHPGPYLGNNHCFHQDCGWSLRLNNGANKSAQ